MCVTSQWNQWDNCHNSPEQQKRLESARTSACTPTTLDKEKAVATFQSKRGNYTTSLIDCNCTDYKRRNLPCKHMYRLALEMNLISGSVSSYLHGGYTWVQAVELIEQFPDNVQQEFYTQLRDSCQHSSPYKRKKNQEIDALIAAGFLVEYTEKETACYKTVHLIEDFLVDKQKLQWYFSRKYFPKKYFDGVNMVIEPLPEDDVTAFLRERGFA